MKKSGRTIDLSIHSKANSVKKNKNVKLQSDIMDQWKVNQAGKKSDGHGHDHDNLINRQKV